MAPARRVETLITASCGPCPSRTRAASAPAERSVAAEEARAFAPGERRQPAAGQRAASPRQAARASRVAAVGRPSAPPPEEDRRAPLVGAGLLEVFDWLDLASWVLR